MQIIKAVLLLAGASFMALMVMKSVNFDFNTLFAEAVKVHPKGIAIMSPGGLVSDPISALSLGTALMFGTAGLPHILMRFFTVSDAKEARKSVFYATGFIGYFYILTFIIGFGAILLVSANPAFKDATGALLGGTNMAAVHGQCRWRQLLPRLYLGGGLRHHSGGRCRPDAGRRIGRFPRSVRQRDENGKATERDELKVSKITVVVLGTVAIALGILFEKQNIAFMVGLAFSIAASCNFLSSSCRCTGRV